MPPNAHAVTDADAYLGPYSVPCNRHRRHGSDRISNRFLTSVLRWPYGGVLRYPCERGTERRDANAAIVLNDWRDHRVMSTRKRRCSFYAPDRHSPSCHSHRAGPSAGIRVPDGVYACGWCCCRAIQPRFHAVRARAAAITSLGWRTPEPDCSCYGAPSVGARTAWAIVAVYVVPRLLSADHASVPFSSAGQTRCWRTGPHCQGVTPRSVVGHLERDGLRRRPRTPVGARRGGVAGLRALWRRRRRGRG